MERPVELAVAAAVEPVSCCLPLEASSGLVPARAAKDASLVMRCGSPLETSSCAAQTGPTPHSVSRCGRDLADESAGSRSISAISSHSCSTAARSGAGRRLLASRDGGVAAARASQLALGQRCQGVDGAGRARSRSGRSSWLSAAVRARDCASPLEQEHAQLLALATAARQAQPFAGNEPAAASAASIRSFLPPRRSRGAAAHTHTPAHRLGLRGIGPARRRSCRIPQPRTPVCQARVAHAKQPPVSTLVASIVNGCRAAAPSRSSATATCTSLCVSTPIATVQSSHVASSHRWVDRPGQGCVGQRTQASIRSPASRTKRRRETGPI